MACKSLGEMKYNVFVLLKMSNSDKDLLFRKRLIKFAHLLIENSTNNRNDRWKFSDNARVISNQTLI